MTTADKTNNPCFTAAISAAQPRSKIMKMTARNNAVVARVKREYNHKIFAKFSLVYNQDGPDAARVYIGQFTRAECRTATVDGLFQEEVKDDLHGGKACPQCNKAELDRVGDCPVCDPWEEDGWDD